jgi:hypothetical protein
MTGSFRCIFRDIQKIYKEKAVGGRHAEEPLGVDWIVPKQNEEGLWLDRKHAVVIVGLPDANAKMYRTGKRIFMRLLITPL